MNIYLASKQCRRPKKKFNIKALQDPTKRSKFQCLSADANVEQQWDGLESAIHKACTETIGHTSRKHQDWFDEKMTVILSRSGSNTSTSKLRPKRRSVTLKQVVGRESQSNTRLYWPTWHAELLPSDEGYLWVELKWSHSSLVSKRDSPER